MTERCAAAIGPTSVGEVTESIASVHGVSAPLRVLGVDPELGFAGGETQVLGLTLGLIRAGHRAELACDPRGRLSERARREGIDCHPLSIRNGIDVAAGMRLRNLLSRIPFDVVHFHTSRAHSLAPFARGKARALVVTRRMDYRPNRLFAPYLYNRAVDAVAAISSKVADALREAGVARERVTIIPSGVDCERFRPAAAAERDAARARLGLAPDEFVVGSVGMLEERKGYRYLLEALAILKRDHMSCARFKCVIAGDGALRHELTRLASDKRIADDVVFTGMVQDSRTVLDAIDVFVFPSLKEGLGVALLEAMACGLPVVASRAGGVVDIVEQNRSGLLVAPEDSASIAGRLATLASNAAARSSMGMAARTRIVDHFSMLAMTRSTIDLYHSCFEAGR